MNEERSKSIPLRTGKGENNDGAKQRGEMVWAVIAIIGMQFLGIDIKEIVAMLSDMQQQAETIQVKSHGLCSGDIALPALVGIYAWGRTKLKQTREQSGAEKVET